MKLNLKSALALVVGAFSFLVGFTNVFAATLTETAVDGYFYTRRGGGQSYMSAQWKLYDIDGKAAYCIEPGVNITIHDYDGAIGYINSPYSDEINQKIGLIGYYGYNYPGHQTLRYRAAAQSLIWETTGGQIVEFWTEKYGNGSFINLNKERNDIMSLVNSHYTMPSFNNETKDAIIGQTVSFTDNTGVLSGYEIYRSDNATSSINGNTLNITPNAVGEITVSLIKKTYTSDPTMIFVGKDSKSQKMGMFGVHDPVVAKVKLNVKGGRVEIIKTDSDTGTTTPSGQASLVGAKFGVYDVNDNLITTLTTDSNSYAISDYLPSLNVFYIKELEAPKGYVLNTEKYYFKLDKDNLLASINISNKVIERKYEITKVVASNKTQIMTPEVNVEFGIYDYNNNLIKTLKTDSDGKIYFTLPFGDYILRQLSTPSGFEKIDDYKFSITESGPTINKVFSNAEITSRVKIIKVDDLGNRIAIAGIKFKIKELSTGKYVCQKVAYPNSKTYCEFETDDTGMLITPYPLNSGDYELEEVDQKINGYLWNSEPLRFSINEKSNIISSDDFDKILELRFTNKEVKGAIEIKKTGEKLVIENGKYTYETIPLPNVVFDVYDENNNLVGTITTDENGYARLDNLKLQKYTLKEVSSSLSHLIDNNVYEFELVYKDQYTPIITKTFTLKNYLPKGTLEFTKTDYSTDKALPNTVIEIYTEEDVLMGTYTTDDKGMVIIKDLPLSNCKRYYILEKQTSDSSYLLNEEKMYFEINENGEVIKANMKNEKIKGSLEFTKVDLSTSNPIPNTKIEIYNADTDELIYSGFTDENGKIIIDNLEYGRYYIKEVETASPDYILNTEKIYFEIRENGEVVKATMTNEKVEMPKTFNTDLTSSIIIISTAVLGLGLLIYAKKKNK